MVANALIQSMIIDLADTKLSFNLVVHSISSSRLLPRYCTAGLPPESSSWLWGYLGDSWTLMFPPTPDQVPFSWGFCFFGFSLPGQFANRFYILSIFVFSCSQEMGLSVTVFSIITKTGNFSGVGDFEAHNILTLTTQRLHPCRNWRLSKFRVLPWTLKTRVRRTSDILFGMRSATLRNKNCKRFAEHISVPALIGDQKSLEMTKTVILVREPRSHAGLMLPYLFKMKSCQIRV